MRYALILARLLIIALLLPGQSAVAAPPVLQLEPSTNGRLRLTAMNLGTNSAIVEQTRALGAANGWSMAPVALGGAFRPNAANLFFRLRVVPTTIQPSGSAAVIRFESAPASLRAGAAAQFEVSQPAGLVREIVWLVDGQVGGTTNTGVISPNGRYTAPAAGADRVVEIRVRATLFSGAIVEANAFVTVRGPALTTGAQLISATSGGVALSPDGEIKLTVPPGALAADEQMVIENLLPVASLEDTEDVDALALFEAHPDRMKFLQPVQVEFPLNRWMEPGSTLPLSVFRNNVPGNWQEDGQATVLPGGFRAVASLNHFSLWSVRRFVVGGPLRPLPVITSVEPNTLREGELRPLLLRGTDLATVRKITVHDLNGMAAGSMEVRSFAFASSAPGEMGVMLKSLPDTSLPAGATRAYRLRLNVGLGFAEVNFTVQGLNEFGLLPGQVFTVPATPATNRETFSRIQLRLGSSIISQARVLAWQATDTVEIFGSILARGTNGPPALGVVPGRLPTAARDLSGAGDGQPVLPASVAGFIPAGRPTVSVNLNDFLRGAAARIYGQPGRSSAGSDEEAIGEEMYARYAAEVRAAIGSGVVLDFNLWREIAEDLTADHAEGLQGQQGRPGGFVGLAPYYGSIPIGRRMESGGGGGGGGSSAAYQLAGGSGGGGGGAVSFIAGGTLTFGADGSDGSLFIGVDTSGGNGGPGGRAVGVRARGGGGGPGGAGTIHMLGGERLVSSPTVDIRHEAGRWGEGGFLMTVDSHRQAEPHSWLAPNPGTPDYSQAEVAGPDFSSAGNGIRTSIRRERLVEATLLNFPIVEGTPHVLNRNGSTPMRFTGIGRNRRVRLILAPGGNSIVVTSAAERAVLNREILVLETPDSDGDCIPDAEEIALGFNPNSPDTDGDGISDCDEWLGGGQSAPGDADGDGFPDAAEITAGSDPNDPGSTPVNTPDAHGAVIIAGPQSARVVRPALGAAQGVPFGVVTATPASAVVVRPALTAAASLANGPHVARPQSLRVERQ